MVISPFLTPNSWATALMVCSPISCFILECILNPPSTSFFILSLGDSLLILIPALSSSFISEFTIPDLSTSVMIMSRSAPLATDKTSLPRPFPSLAPSIRPGTSNI
ncbi:hypothetical protein A2985_02375 [Candidatus Woesebacteria bacterium RIFCSPLOWO2_01_FULL_43_11]|nr:MAG: hypothetical protein A2985_02375 [Candidatus Woesebacteria bacterium RIFCSPLOWO2_01_FULL_43_11]